MSQRPSGREAVAGYVICRRINVRSGLWNPYCDTLFRPSTVLGGRGRAIAKYLGPCACALVKYQIFWRLRVCVNVPNPKYFVFSSNFPVYFVCVILKCQIFHRLRKPANSHRWLRHPLQKRKRECLSLLIGLEYGPLSKRIELVTLQAN